MELHLTFTNSQYILDNWVTIEQALIKNFLGSEFIGNFTYERPAKHTFICINGINQNKYIHLLCFDNNQVLLGALFCIPENNPFNENSCDLGWFYVSNSLTPFIRIRITDGIMNLAHKKLQELGFKEVRTEMGTKAGAKIMSSRFGYKNISNDSKENLWVKSLIEI